MCIDIQQQATIALAQSTSLQNLMMSLSVLSGREAI